LVGFNIIVQNKTICPVGADIKALETPIEVITSPAAIPGTLVPKSKTISNATITQQVCTTFVKIITTDFFLLLVEDVA